MNTIDSVEDYVENKINDLVGFLGVLSSIISDRSLGVQVSHSRIVTSQFVDVFSWSSFIYHLRCGGYDSLSPLIL